MIGAADDVDHDVALAALRWLGAAEHATCAALSFLRTFGLEPLTVLAAGGMVEYDRAADLVSVTLRGHRELAGLARWDALHVVCRCGHDYGDHANASPHPCGELEPDLEHTGERCLCRGFEAARAPRAAAE